MKNQSPINDPVAQPPESLGREVSVCCWIVRLTILQIVIENAVEFTESQVKNQIIKHDKSSFRLRRTHSRGNNFGHNWYFLIRLVP